MNTALQIAQLLPALKTIAGDGVEDISILTMTIRVTPEYWNTHIETLAGVDIETVQFKHQGEDWEARTILTAEDEVTIKAFFPVEAEPPLEEQWAAAKKEEQEILDCMFKAGD